MTLALRTPDRLMRLNRLGSFHPSRMSFMHQLLRRMGREDWRYERRLFDINSQGVGRAVLTMHGPQRSYSLVAFAHDLPDELRSDRVIAQAWDATFCLYDGIPSEEDISRLETQVPGQETARLTPRELCLSRANRSVRLWDSVVEALSQGRQPEAEELAEVGYLMRTTAVYGSGKFGLCDRFLIADREELNSPFQAEMLTVFLIRQFVRDLINTCARNRGGDAAVELDSNLAQSLGIGNSTGLGMAPFLLNHPRLMHRWIASRESALEEICNEDQFSDFALKRAQNRVAEGLANLPRWRSVHPYQIERVAQLQADLRALAEMTFDSPAQSLDWVETHLSDEGCEYWVTCLLEAYPEISDRWAQEMSIDESVGFEIDGRWSLHQALEAIEEHFSWALECQWTDADIARVWYVSQEKLEPRLGERAEEPVEEFEQPLAPGRDMAALKRALVDSNAINLATFLRQHPEHRHAVRRLQWACRFPFGEIHDNTISAQLKPIDMLRLKLSFFGANYFDPRSDRWLRICMFADAPYADQLKQDNAEAWG